MKSKTSISEARTHAVEDSALLALVALTVVVGSQLLRVMITLQAWWLRSEVGTLGVIPYALAPFLLALTAVAVARPVRMRGALAFASGVMVVARLVEQISHASSVDLWSALIGVTAFLWLFPLLAALNLRIFGVGFVLGLTGDSALKAAFRTLDLSWMEGWLALALVLLLTAGLAVAAAATVRRDLVPRRPVGRHVLAPVALGPLLFVTWQVLTSPGWLSTQTGWSPEVASAVITLGLAGAAWAAVKRPPFSAIFASAVVMIAVGALARWSSPWVGILAVIGLVGVGVVVAAVTGSDTHSGVAATTVAALAAGNVLLVILVFAYYTTLDLALPLRQPGILLVGGGLVALFVLFGTASHDYPLARRWPVVVALSALVVPAGLWLQRTQTSIPTVALPTFTVMSYNIAQGIAVGGQLDPEGLAVVIEGSGSTVVGLQEVSRNFLIASGTDLVWWLSNRLNLPYAYGWAEDGGNATLTRYPVAGTTLHKLPRLGTLQQRTALETVLVYDGQEVVILNTHLTQLVTPAIADAEKEADYSVVQIPQLESVLAGWGRRARTVVVGDFNIRPEWRQTRVLIEAGLLDGWDAGTGPGYTTEDEGRGYRIDYVFHTPDLEAVEARVIESGASLDHLPVVATLMVR